MSIFENISIYNDFEMPCVHNSAADLYMNIEALLSSSGKSSLDTFMPATKLMQTLLASVPEHRGSTYLGRYFESPIRNTAAIKAYNWNGDNIYGLSVFFPLVGTSLALVDVRFSRISVFDAFGEIRVGDGLSNSKDEFDIAKDEDYTFGQTVFSLVARRANYQFK